MHLGVAGLEINGEYARSARYSRYPAQLDGEPIFDQASRSVEHGSAYFLNATRWFGPARAGGEYFSMNPEFQTGMRNFVDMESGLWETNLASMANTTVYWDLVEDNEDGDRYPDFRLGNLLGMPFDSQHYDPDGVFPGQDDDVDGFPDTNRNGNTTPDYEEPFLMYYVEPIDYVYGLDRNNNDQPDAREDDLDFDYPYDLDQRGYHLFGLMDLTRHWSVGVGRYAIEQVAGAGRNKSVYAQLSYRREGVARLRRLFFENHFRRVKDDIADEARLVDENPRRDRRLGYRGPEPVATGEIGPPIFGSSLRQDPLLYQDSYVGESYLEARLRPWSTLRLAQQATPAAQLAAEGAVAKRSRAASAANGLLHGGQSGGIHLVLGESESDAASQVHALASGGPASRPAGQRRLHQPGPDVRFPDDSDSCA